MLAQGAWQGSGAWGYLAYSAPGSILVLVPYDGDGSKATPMVVAGTGSLENSQCRVNAQGLSGGG